MSIIASGRGTRFNTVKKTNNLVKFIACHSSQFNSSICLDQLYPGSDKKSKPVPPVASDSSFNGFIPIDNIQITHDSETKVDIR